MISSPGSGFVYIILFFGFVVIEIVVIVWQGYPALINREEKIIAMSIFAGI